MKNRELRLLMFLKGYKKEFGLWVPDPSRNKIHKYIRKSEWRKRCFDKILNG